MEFLKGNPKLTIEHEIEKLQILSDYFIPSQFSTRCDFIKFEECLVVLSFEKKFNAKQIFLELTDNRKFLTHKRLLNKYIQYKTTPKEISLECKKFFSHLFEIINVKFILTISTQIKL
jgi:hypothetical protein